MTLYRKCLECGTLFILSTCTKCNSDNSVLVNVWEVKGKDGKYKTKYERGEITEIKSKIQYWNEQINKAKYNIKNRKKDLIKVRMKIKKEKLKID